MDPFDKRKVKLLSTLASINHYIVFFSSMRLMPRTRLDDDTWQIQPLDEDGNPLPFDELTDKLG